jgi:hypothetical protein
VPDHPDHEQLAAWQAGALDEPDQGRTAAHVAGCPDCRAVVGTVEGVRRQLAVLDEPELPAGLHDRLIAAVESDQEPGSLPARRAARRQRPPWYRRPATWSAAAAVLLFAAGVFGLAQLGGGGGGEEAGGGGAAASAPAPAARPGPGGNQPDTASGAARSGRADAGALLRLSGEFSPAKLQAALRDNTSAREAVHRASAFTPQSEKENDPGPMMSRGPAAGSLGSLLPADSACSDRIGSAGQVRPVLVATGTSKGRDIKILVAYVGDRPGQLRYWTFPATGCVGAPLSEGKLDPA